MTSPSVTLYEFMPYGAPELKEVSKRYMTRALGTAAGAWLVVFGLSFGTNEFLKHKPRETSVIVVPYRELAAPPPLSQDAPPPQVQIAQPVAPPTVGVAVPVPDAEAPPEQTIASQEDIAQATPGVSKSEGELVVAPPSEDDMPKLGDYVYVEEYPEVITAPKPEYPSIAQQANVDGQVELQVLVGKDGHVKDVKVVKSIPMLDAAAIAAAKQYIFKPALSNNRPVAVWVRVPMRFSLQ